MIKSIYLIFLNFLIFIIDRKNKKKIKNFFFSKLKNKSITLIDVGAHKGETIKMFKKYFNIKKIYGFEPNPKIFKILIKSVCKNNVKLFNIALGIKKEKKLLNTFFETSSSSINKIDKNTLYYKRKMKIFAPVYKDIKFKKVKINTNTLSNVLSSENIHKIDILKIDTEGYEYNVLKGINKFYFNKINFVYFEHHYDLMIKKNYKFSDIDRLLKKHNFVKKFKIKMSLRKTFEYIYEKKR